MFYRVVAGIVKGLIFIINGKTSVQNREKLPKEGTFILVGPHRSILDPVFFALAAYPRPFTFMAKEELFKNKLLGWFITKLGAFPVNRDNPGPSALKVPVKGLKDQGRNLIIFPSGSRHSNDLKGGAVTIAKLSGAPIIPVVYQGPLKIGGLFSRKKTSVRFGEPIVVDRKTKLDKENIQLFDQQMQDAFKQLDHEINPEFVYLPKEKK